MPEKEYRMVCSHCGEPIKEKPLRVLRFSREDKVRWDKLAGRISSGRGRFWGMMGPTLVLLVMTAATLPFIMPLTLFGIKVTNPLYSVSWDLAMTTSRFLSGFLFGDESKTECGFIVLFILAVALFLAVYVPLAVRHHWALKRRKAELLDKYGFQEGEEGYVVEEEAG